MPAGKSAHARRQGRGRRRLAAHRPRCQADGVRLMSRRGRRTCAAGDSAGSRCPGRRVPLSAVVLRRALGAHAEACHTRCEAHGHEAAFCQAGRRIGRTRMAATWRQTAVPAVTSGTADGAATGPWVPARRNGRRTRCVYLLEGLFPGTPPPHPRGQRLCDGLGPAASLLRVPGMGPAGRLAMSKAETGSRSPVLEEAARELEAAAHDARVAADAAVPALQAALLAASTAAGS